MTLVHSEKPFRIRYDNRMREIPAGLSEQEEGVWRYARSKGHVVREAFDHEKAAHLLGPPPPMAGEPVEGPPPVEAVAPAEEEVEVEGDDEEAEVEEKPKKKAKKK